VVTACLRLLGSSVHHRGNTDCGKVKMPRPFPGLGEKAF
jgi:hypothetical protein